MSYSLDFTIKHGKERIATTATALLADKLINAVWSLAKTKTIRVYYGGRVVWNSARGQSTLPIEVIIKQKIVEHKREYARKMGVL